MKTVEPYGPELSPSDPTYSKIFAEFPQYRTVAINSKLFSANNFVIIEKGHRPWSTKLGVRLKIAQIIRIFDSGSGLQALVLWFLQARRCPPAVAATLPPGAAPLDPHLDLLWERSMEQKTIDLQHIANLTTVYIADFDQSPEQVVKKRGVIYALRFGLKERNGTLRLLPFPREKSKGRPVARLAKIDEEQPTEERTRRQSFKETSVDIDVEPAMMPNRKSFKPEEPPMSNRDDVSLATRLKRNSLKSDEPPADIDVSLATRNKRKFFKPDEPAVSSPDDASLATRPKRNSLKNDEPPADNGVSPSTRHKRKLFNVASQDLGAEAARPKVKPKVVMEGPSTSREDGKRQTRSSGNEPGPSKNLQDDTSDEPRRQTRSSENEAGASNNSQYDDIWNEPSPSEAVKMSPRHSVKKPTWSSQDLTRTPEKSPIRLRFSKSRKILEDTPQSYDTPVDQIFPKRPPRTKLLAKAVQVDSQDDTDPFDEAAKKMQERIQKRMTDFLKPVEKVSESESEYKLGDDESSDDDVIVDTTPKFKLKISKPLVITSVEEVKETRSSKKHNKTPPASKTGKVRPSLANIKKEKPGSFAAQFKKPAPFHHDSDDSSEVSSIPATRAKKFTSQQAGPKPSHQARPRLVVSQPIRVPPPTNSHDYSDTSSVEVPFLDEVDRKITVPGYIEVNRQIKKPEIKKNQINFIDSSDEEPMPGEKLSPSGQQLSPPRSQRVETDQQLSPPRFERVEQLSRTCMQPYVLLNRIESTSKVQNWLLATSSVQKNKSPAKFDSPSTSVPENLQETEESFPEKLTSPAKSTSTAANETFSPKKSPVKSTPETSESEEKSSPEKLTSPAKSTSTAANATFSPQKSPVKSTPETSESEEKSSPEKLTSPAKKSDKSISQNSHSPAKSTRSNSDFSNKTIVESLQKSIIAEIHKNHKSEFIANSSKQGDPLESQLSELVETSDDESFIGKNERAKSQKLPDNSESDEENPFPKELRNEVRSEEKNKTPTKIVGRTSLDSARRVLSMLDTPEKIHPVQILLDKNISLRELSPKSSQTESPARKQVAKKFCSPSSSSSNFQTPELASVVSSQDNVQVIPSLGSQNKPLISPATLNNVRRSPRKESQSSSSVYGTPNVTVDSDVSIISATPESVISNLQSQIKEKLDRPTQTMNCNLESGEKTPVRVTQLDDFDYAEFVFSTPDPNCTKKTPVKEISCDDNDVFEIVHESRSLRKSPRKPEIIPKCLLTSSPKKSSQVTPNPLPEKSKDSAGESPKKFKLKKLTGDLWSTCSLDSFESVHSSNSPSSSRRKQDLSVRNMSEESDTVADKYLIEKRKRGRPRKNNDSSQDESEKEGASKAEELFDQLDKTSSQKSIPPEEEEGEYESVTVVKPIIAMKAAIPKLLTTQKKVIIRKKKTTSQASSEEASTSQKTTSQASSEEASTSQSQSEKRERSASPPKKNKKVFNEIKPTDLSIDVWSVLDEKWKKNRESRKETMEFLAKHPEPSLSSGEFLRNGSSDDFTPSSKARLRALTSESVQPSDLVVTSRAGPVTMTSQEESRDAESEVSINLPQDKITKRKRKSKRLESRSSSSMSTRSLSRQSSHYDSKESNDASSKKNLRNKQKIKKDNIDKNLLDSDDESSSSNDDEPSRKYATRSRQETPQPATRSKSRQHVKTQPKSQRTKGGTPQNNTPKRNETPQKSKENTTKRSETPQKSEENTPKRNETPQKSRENTPRRSVKTPGSKFATPSKKESAKKKGRREKCTPKKAEEIEVQEMPGREREMADILSFVQCRILEGTSGCMYISGVPGTGKTASVTQVVRSLQQLEDLPDFRLVQVSGMELTQPQHVFCRVAESLLGLKTSASVAQERLQKYFLSEDPRKPPTLLVIDELDMLCTRRQDVVYSLFEWPSKPQARLVVLAIANTLDLPERALKGRVASRLGLNRQPFHPYTFGQLEKIVAVKLAHTHQFDPDARQLVARKVASVSGDARRALDICRRAQELAGTKMVGMSHVTVALDEMLNSKTTEAIRNCSALGRLLLRCLMLEMKRTGLEESTFENVFLAMQGRALLDDLQMCSVTLALDSLAQLSSLRLVLTQEGDDKLKQRLALNVAADDLHYALLESSSGEHQN